ncbi:MAG: hypothetical protein N4A32_07585 [Marinifilaceae bacterium]|jgi:hypothetical protein|nr:hypothetical protein [Marinifilaceae bacterium]
MKNTFKIILISIFLILVLASSYNDVSRLIGQEDVSADKIFSSMATDLQGDGYSFTIYKVDKNTIDKFVKDSLKVNYPIFDKKIDNLVHWKHTPFLNEDVFSIIFGQHTYNIKEVEQFATLRNALSEDLNYYAIAYSKSLTDIIELHFYLLDVRNEKLFSFDFYL